MATPCTSVGGLGGKSLPGVLLSDVSRGGSRGILDDDDNEGGPVRWSCCWSMSGDRGVLAAVDETGSGGNGGDSPTPSPAAGARLKFGIDGCLGGGLGNLLSA